MKTNVTLLTKELKSIQRDIAQILEEDESQSSVPISKEGTPYVSNDYSYESNRNRVKELQNRERLIHFTLSKFNLETKVEGYDLFICEALVRINQIKIELKTINRLAHKSQIHSNDYSCICNSEDNMYRCSYDVRKAQKDMRRLEAELSKLQVAVDKTNLNSEIDY